MKSCFSNLPVKDGTSGAWTLDSFEISIDMAVCLFLRAATEDIDAVLQPGNYRRLSNGRNVVMTNLKPFSAAVFMIFMSEEFSNQLYVRDLKVLSSLIN